MSIKDWLSHSIDQLRQAGVETARLDTEILLAHALQKDRSWIHINGEYVLSDEAITRLKIQITRRARHEPVAYILGYHEFYGRTFAVNQDTLTPRPETETLVELAIDFIKSQSITSVTDVGTGTGCIAITLDLETNAKIIATDISEKALDIARANNKTLGSTVEFRLSDVHTDPTPEASLVVANLPYVPVDYTINKAAEHEPAVALFSGKDGLDHYRKLFNNLSAKTEYVITESLETQHEELAAIARVAGFMLVDSRDLVQIFSREPKTT